MKTLVATLSIAAVALLANAAGTRPMPSPAESPAALTTGWLDLNTVVVAQEDCKKRARACIKACDDSYKVGTPSHSGCRTNCNAGLCN